MATPTTVPWGWFYAGFNEANTKIYHPPYGGAKIYHPQFLRVPNHRLIILGVVNNIFARFLYPLWALLIIGPVLDSCNQVH